MKHWPETEADLAKPVVDWLKDLRWEVYEEVQVSAYSHAADIVAIQGKLVWVVECKRSLSLSLLEQAWRWRPYSNYTSIAIPRPTRMKHHPGHRVAKRFIRERGIGMLWVEKHTNEMLPEYTEIEVQEDVPTKLNRKAFTRRLLDGLREEHKTFAVAGSSLGKRYTPFRATCDAVRREVERQPGITMKELIDAVPTHYAHAASARSSLYKNIIDDLVDGVRLEREGRLIRLYPTKEAVGR